MEDKISSFTINGESSFTTYEIDFNRISPDTVDISFNGKHGGRFHHVPEIFDYLTCMIFDKEEHVSSVKMDKTEIGVLTHMSLIYNRPILQNVKSDNVIVQYLDTYTKQDFEVLVTQMIDTIDSLADEVYKGLYYGGDIIRIDMGFLND